MKDIRKCAINGANNYLFINVKFMGCDIHAYAEKLEKNGKWKMIHDFPNSNYRENSEYSWEKYPTTEELYDERDYEFFSLLADVRNHDNIVPISQSKGIPEDIGKEVGKIIKEWGEDGHSHSYFTLEELKGIPKDIISQEIFDNSLILGKDEDGNITEVCRGTNGKHLGAVGKRKLFSTFKDEKNPLFEIIEKLESKKGKLKDDEIRMVFFFDN
jgi:hypothetical protein